MKCILILAVGLITFTSSAQEESKVVLHTDSIQECCTPPPPPPLTDKELRVKQRQLNLALVSGTYIIVTWINAIKNKIK